MASQWWAGPHLYCPCLEVHIDPLLKLQDPEEFAGTLCPSSQRDIESIAFFLLITICLFSWFIEDGWPALAWGTHRLYPSRQHHTGVSVTDISQWKPPRSWGKHTNVWHYLSFASIVHLRNPSLCFGHKSRRRKKVHILRASEPGGHHGKAN